MRLIVLSSPQSLKNEGQLVNSLFDSGMACMHLRKPLSTESSIRVLLDSIDTKHYPRLSLHQHHGLAIEYGMGGIHFGEHSRLTTPVEDLERWREKGFRLSTSVHAKDALADLPACFSYAFLSPVFDSISKSGYRGIAGEGFCLNEEEKKVPVIGLGGVDATTIKALKDMNFDGAAVLGAVWTEPGREVENFNQLNKYAS